MLRSPVVSVSLHKFRNVGTLSLQVPFLRPPSRSESTKECCYSIYVYSLRVDNGFKRFYLYFTTFIVPVSSFAKRFLTSSNSCAVVWNRTKQVGNSKLKYYGYKPTLSCVSQHPDTAYVGGYYSSPPTTITKRTSHDVQKRVCDHPFICLANMLFL